MASDFTSKSVAYGLSNGEFVGMDKKKVRKLRKLMARISEASYRRGLQHGEYLTQNDALVVDTSDFRFYRSLANSPFADQKNAGYTSIARFDMENSMLYMIGLGEMDE